MCLFANCNSDCWASVLTAAGPLLAKLQVLLGQAVQGWFQVLPVGLRAAEAQVQQWM